MQTGRMEGAFSSKAGEYRSCLYPFQSCKTWRGGDGFASFEGRNMEKPRVLTICKMSNSYWNGIWRYCSTPYFQFSVSNTFTWGKKNCAWAAEVKLTVRLLRKNTELKNTKLFLSVWHGKELPLCDNLTLTLGWLWHWIHFWSQLITMEQGGVQVDSSWGQAPVNFENLWWNKLFEKWESWVLNFQ